MFVYLVEQKNRKETLKNETKNIPNQVCGNITVHYSCNKTRARGLYEESSFCR